VTQSAVSGCSPSASAHSCSNASSPPLARSVGTLVTLCAPRHRWLDCDPADRSTAGKQAGTQPKRRQTRVPRYESGMALILLAEGIRAILPIPSGGAPCGGSIRSTWLAVDEHVAAWQGTLTIGVACAGADRGDAARCLEAQHLAAVGISRAQAEPPGAWMVHCGGARNYEDQPVDTSRRTWPSDGDTTGGRTG